MSSKADEMTGIMESIVGMARIVKAEMHDECRKLTADGVMPLAPMSSFHRGVPVVAISSTADPATVFPSLRIGTFGFRATQVMFCSEVLIFDKTIETSTDVVQEWLVQPQPPEGVSHGLAAVVVADDGSSRAVQQRFTYDDERWLHWGEIETADPPEGFQAMFDHLWCREARSERMQEMLDHETAIAMRSALNCDVQLAPRLPW